MPTKGDTAPKAIKSFLGFKKLYNFVLWFIFGGALLGFCLARAEYLNPAIFAVGASPGEWYWYRKGLMKIGILLHLAGAVPAGILAPLQFIPNIRYKKIILHRINGYTIITLMTAAIIGALIVSRHAFGSSINVQTATVTISGMVLTAFSMAIYNIKRLQIDQHRKWMLRGMFWMSFIVTERLILIIGAQIATAIGGYNTIWTCDEISFTMNNPQMYNQLFPHCANGTFGPTSAVAVPAAFNFGTVFTGSALRTVFGMSLWLALGLHAFGVECYLALTKDESERLRRISYERQMERGFPHPGSAGICSDRLGDSAWEPPKQLQQKHSFHDSVSDTPNTAALSAAEYQPVSYQYH